MTARTNTYGIHKAIAESNTYGKPDKNGTSLTAETLKELIKLIPPAPPLFFSSGVIAPDACYKMRPDQLDFYSMANCFDKNTKEVYVCGVTVRDALIEKGVVFQNYKPELLPEEEK